MCGLKHIPFKVFLFQKEFKYFTYYLYKDTVVEVQKVFQYNSLIILI